MDAIFIGDYQSAGTRRQILKDSVKAIREAKRENLLRSDHRLHLRCEISDAKMLELFSPYIEEKLVKLCGTLPVVRAVWRGGKAIG